MSSDVFLRWDIWNMLKALLFSGRQSAQSSEYLRGHADAVQTMALWVGYTLPVPPVPNTSPQVIDGER